MSESALRIGIAGLGTVGGGTVKLLAENAALIQARCGRKIEIKAVSARDKAKHADLPLHGVRFEVDAVLIAASPDIDVVVEVIGGSDGIAKSVVETALKNGKSVVTANKALIAHHGLALAALAEEHGAQLTFEAAVAGGIPIIKALRDGLAANNFTRVVGILNGTCNYILTQMWERHASFADVLKDAQHLGYAEAEPSFDVDGIDTAHKLAILASLAFGGAPHISGVRTQGIRHITLSDMEAAHVLGYRIKLLGIAQMHDGTLEQRVHPCMVPVSSPLANVHGVYNAIVAQGDAVGTVFFEGRGAGAGPTASSVVADIMDIARGARYWPFTLPLSSLQVVRPAEASNAKSAYYLRLSVIDRAGVLADVTGLFRKHNISVRSFLQHSRQPGEVVQMVMTTHETTEAAMSAALEHIKSLDAVREAPCLIRIEEL